MKTMSQLAKAPRIGKRDDPCLYSIAARMGEHLCVTFHPEDAEKISVFCPQHDFEITHYDADGNPETNDGSYYVVGMVEFYRDRFALSIFRVSDSIIYRHRTQRIFFPYEVLGEDRLFLTIDTVSPGAPNRRSEDFCVTDSEVIYSISEDIGTFQGSFSRLAS